MEHELVIGVHVFTADGVDLGRVKAVKGDAFHVDVPHHLDYWLDVSDVLNASSERVTMTFAHTDVGAYRKDHPHDVVVAQEALPRAIEPETARGRNF